MPSTDAMLTITLEPPASSAAQTLVIRCPHGTTTLDLPALLDAAAKRSVTAVAVLQHYSTTGCSCTRHA
jgi:hypothetical protein